MVEPRVASVGSDGGTDAYGVRPPDAPPPDDRLDSHLVEEERLVEDVSIDGMCGVY
jgi:mycofactocin precursor